MDENKHVSQTKIENWNEIDTFPRETKVEQYNRQVELSETSTLTSDQSEILPKHQFEKKLKFDQNMWKGSELEYTRGNATRACY